MDRCPSCGTEADEHLYLSGKMKQCYDCQRFDNLTAAAGKVPNSHRTPRPSIEMSKAEFVSLIRTLGLTCGYCGIDRDFLYLLEVKGTNGRWYESIGIDRIDNDRGYVEGNMIRCCALCNGVKSGFLTYDEMMVLGPVLRQIWEARL